MRRWRCCRPRAKHGLKWMGPPTAARVLAVLNEKVDPEEANTAANRGLQAVFVQQVVREVVVREVVVREVVRQQTASLLRDPGREGPTASALAERNRARVTAAIRPVARRRRRKPWYPPQTFRLKQHQRIRSDPKRLPLRVVEHPKEASEPVQPYSIPAPPVTNRKPGGDVTNPDVPPPAVSIRELAKSYVLKSETVYALRGVSFDVPEGDYVAIMGPSGSGKSTLLNLLGCLDKPTTGQFFLGHDDVSMMSDDELADIRSRRIGFVFQSYNLIQQYTVVENIQLPLYYQGRLGPKEKQRAIELATSVGLGDRLSHRPMQLSGGQQQRVAIARSLMNDPYFILADEATGNLDSSTTDEILGLFDSLNAEGRTIVMVTHEDEVAARAKRVVRLRDGLLSSDRLNSEESRQQARVRQSENVLVLAQRKH